MRSPGAWGTPWSWTVCTGTPLERIAPVSKLWRSAGWFIPCWGEGVGKAEIRALARAVGLPNHDAPSNSCLASRVAHGESISVEILERVERAESFLAELGFRQVRVRTRSGEARVEVEPSQVSQLRSPDTSQKVQRHLQSLGFTRVQVDPHGYRPSGARIPSGKLLPVVQEP